MRKYDAGPVGLDRDRDPSLVRVPEEGRT
jgi:hypothetical protein